MAASGFAAGYAAIKLPESRHCWQASHGVCMACWYIAAPENECVCATEAETAWDAWLAALLRNALSAAPMDMAGLWGVAVRFGLNGIIGGRRDAVALSSVLELISEPTGPGAPSACLGADHIQC